MNLNEQAHAIWADYIHSGDCVIDATCGNGYDTLFLAKCVDIDEGGKVFAFDIQEKALQNTQKRLSEHFSKETIHQNVLFFCQCHSVLPSIEKKMGLVVYNLGYLPGGGDKELTTRVKTTLKSLESALNILSSQGALSVMCYPGHPEGKEELRAVLCFCKNLDSKKYLVKNYSSAIKTDSPSLFIIKNILF